MNTNRRIATTIFGEIQNDFIYSGSNRISTIFGLVTSSADQIACRGMLGLSPNTMGTSTINGKVSTFFLKSTNRERKIF